MPNTLRSVVEVSQLKLPLAISTAMLPTVTAAILRVRTVGGGSLLPLLTEAFDWDSVLSFWKETPAVNMIMLR